MRGTGFNILRRKLGRGVLGVLVLLAGTVSGSVVAQEGVVPGEELRSSALVIAAERSGRNPDELSIASEAHLVVPLIGFEGFNFKITDGDELSVDVVLDSRTGAERSSEDLGADSVAAYRSRYGKFVPAEFADRARAAMIAGEELSLLIHIAEPYEDAPVARLDADGVVSVEQVDKVLAELDGIQQGKAEARVAPVRDWLAAQGYEAEELPGTLLLAATLPSDVVAQLEALDEVAALSESDLVVERTLAVQRATMYSNVVEGLGITGAGVRVGEIEVGGLITPANPFLAYTQILPFACAHPHALWVAGVIRSTHSGVRGHAPACQLFVGGSCGGNINQIIQVSNIAAIMAGTRVLNYSLGGNFGGVLSPLDAYVDRLTLVNWRTVVASAGNSGLGGFVNSPGTAYNIITVGSQNDQNSVTWVGDAMSLFSSAVNPGSWMGDREEPKMAAPGDLIETLRPAVPWFGDVVSGTSFSAPATTGVVAQMMQRNPVLTIWPEINRAVLMATSINNIEGAARLSSQDGTGGVVADRADQLVRRVGGNWSGIGYNCPFTPNLLNLTTMNLVAGQRVRAVISWDTDPNYNLYASRPGADLDLFVRRPGNFIVATSLSWDNTYEIVDFVAPVTGVYTMQVNKFRCSFNPQWLGWAWTVV